MPLIATPASAGSLLANGSFENLNNTFVDSGNGCMRVYANDSTTIPDWTVSPGVSGAIAWCNGTTTGDPAADGNYWVDLTGIGNESPNGAVRQTISVATGTRYTVDFYISQDLNDATVKADVDGANIPLNTPLGVGLHWTLLQGSFVGGADTSPYFELYNATPGAYGALIDLASITEGAPVGAPEPASIGLLGLAVAGIGLARRRARRT